MNNNGGTKILTVQMPWKLWRQVQDKLNGRYMTQWVVEAIQEKYQAENGEERGE